MFEFFFKYPAAVFSKGTFVLLGPASGWVLLALIAAAAAALGITLWMRRNRVAPAVQGLRSVLVWMLQSALVALVLLLLWQPAISVAELKPQQNIVAVVVDDSHSMSTVENGSTRIQKAVSTLNSGLIKDLQQKFQVRLYRLGERIERIQKTDNLGATLPATRIGASMSDLLADTATLPVGAIVLLSDGSDNSGGIDLETINEIRRQHIPVHTIGYGKEQFDRDIEMTDVQLPGRALPESRVQAQVALHQNGYTGQRARLTARADGRILGTKDILFKKDAQTEPVLLTVKDPGVQNVVFTIETLGGEENRENNQMTRVLDVEPVKLKVLYIDDPVWDYKFIRRAIEDDKNVEVVSMMRTTQNKNYIQDPTGKAGYLQEGFPTKVEQMFDYQAIILGSVEANYFTSAQQELLHQFVDRRGGGILFRGGRSALADGGYGKPPFSDMLPVRLPERRDTFHRDPAYPELAPAGRDSLICRLEDDPERNVARWKGLPYLMNYQEVGPPKPGAVLLAEMTAGGHKMPLLVTQNYGRGRTAVFATAGDWRWKMQQSKEDQSHIMFWRQLVRWLVNDTPTRVVASARNPILQDNGSVKLRAEVRDTTYLPTSDAQVEARIVDPSGTAQTIAFRPDPLDQGVYTADWSADRPGSYVAEVTAHRGQEDLGRDVVTFRREDGVAENFHREQNRELLEKLSSQTGGRYYRPSEASRLGQDISYSESGITVRETKDLWDMPIVFFVALLLPATQWLLRRKWGVV
ncbi:MAG TPA: glutamine amidotransferase [Bryobacteraceae bacterium]|nr:glutamine amidotransferase [Bryobacteraceae bacterium]